MCMNSKSIHIPRSIQGVYAQASSRRKSSAMRFASPISALSLACHASFSRLTTLMGLPSAVLGNVDHDWSEVADERLNQGGEEISSAAEGSSRRVDRCFNLKDSFCRKCTETRPRSAAVSNVVLVAVIRVVSGALTQTGWLSRKLQRICSERDFGILSEALRGFWGQ